MKVGFWLQHTQNLSNRSHADPVISATLATEASMHLAVAVYPK